MNWQDLSMSEKSDLISLYVKNGISSLEEIKKHYNSFATGGHLYQDGGPDDGKTFVSSQASETGWMPEVQITADRPEWQKGLTNYDWDRARRYYSNENGYITPEGFTFLKNVASKNRTGKSNFMRDVDRLSAIPNAAVGAIGAIPVAAGLIAAAPQLMLRQLARPLETIYGTIGGVSVDKAINAITDYSSWGNLLAKGVFKSENPVLTTALEFTNPGGYFGGALGNISDKRIAEIMLRQGDRLYTLPSATVNFLKNPNTEDLSTIRNVIPTSFNELKPLLKYRFLGNLGDKQRAYNLGTKFNYSGGDAFAPYYNITQNLAHKGDLIDLFLDKKSIDSYFPVTISRKHQDIPEDFRRYVDKNYSNKKSKIKTIDIGKVQEQFVPTPEGVTMNSLTPVGSNIAITDPGGIGVVKEIPNSEWYDMADIWKFNGEDAIKRWSSYKLPVKLFGNFIDAHSSPVITKFKAKRRQMENLSFPSGEYIVNPNWD